MSANGATKKDLYKAIDHLQKRLTELLDENARLRGIIERAKDYCKRMIEWTNYKTVIEILEEADKGEGKP